MPTIKIVPMPGVAVPGPPGPRGYQGDTGLTGPAGEPGQNGAGFEPVRLLPNGFGMYMTYDGLGISTAWGFATKVRLSKWSNRDLYLLATIVNISNPDRNTLTLNIDEDNTNGVDLQSDTWVMELTGAKGVDANTGDIDFSGNNITAHGDMTIGVDVVPGVINLSAYAGVNVQTHADFGLYVNGITPNNKVLTAGNIASANIFPEPVNWSPLITATNFAQTSNTATGQYFKYGKMVVVDMIMSFSDVTNFGVGQYSVNLPFPAAKHGSVFGGTLHSESNGYYSIKGHFDANDSSMTLWYVSVVGKDAEFDNNSPVVLATADAIHMNFIYEIAE